MSPTLVVGAAREGAGLVASRSGNVVAGRAVLDEEEPTVERAVPDEVQVGGGVVAERPLAPVVTGEQWERHEAKPVDEATADELLTERKAAHGPQRQVRLLLQAPRLLDGVVAAKPRIGPLQGRQGP